MASVLVLPLVQGGGKMKHRYHHKNRHHLIPRSRGGGNDRRNLLLIKIDRHETWHRLFGNLTLNEVIGLLIRLKRAKGGP